jgi:hypothetical protein
MPITYKIRFTEYTEKLHLAVSRKHRDKFGQTCLECMAVITIDNQEKRFPSEWNKIAGEEVI